MAFDWRAEVARKAAIQVDHFGDAATYTPPGGGAGTAIKAVRVNPATIETFAPGQNAIRWVNPADFPARPAAGGTLTIGSVIYNITGVKDSDNGGLHLFLDKN